MGEWNQVEKPGELVILGSARIYWRGRALMNTKKPFRLVFIFRWRRSWMGVKRRSNNGSLSLVNPDIKERHVLRSCGSDLWFSITLCMYNRIYIHMICAYAYTIYIFNECAWDARDQGVYKSAGMEEKLRGLNWTLIPRYLLDSRANRIPKAGV